MDEHGRSTRHDDVSVEVLSDVEITLHDRVVGSLVDTRRFETEEGRLEESFRSTESANQSSSVVSQRRGERDDVPLVSDGDDLSIRKFVRFLEGGRLSGGLHLLLKVERDVTELLLDVSNNLSLGGGGEGVSSLHENLDEVVLQLSTWSATADAEEDDELTVKSRPARSSRRMAWGRA